MSKRTEKSKTKSRKAKRTVSLLTVNAIHIFETVWATGVSVAAAMVISTPINSRRAYLCPAHSFPAEIRPK